MDTTLVERKKSFSDHLKMVHDIIDGVGTLLKTGILLVTAVVSLLSYLDTSNRANVVGPPEEVDIANVYNATQFVAVARLEDQGFRPAVYGICSSSVPAGHVRQVVQKTNGQEVVLVDKPGVTEAGRDLRKSASLEVKVSSGVPC